MLNFSDERSKLFDLPTHLPMTFLCCFEVFENK